MSLSQKQTLILYGIHEMYDEDRIIATIDSGLSARRYQDENLRNGNHGCNGFISKPFNAKQIFDELQKAGF